MSGAVAIAGVALSDVGRVDDKGPYELIAQASRRALADAGLTPDDVDGLASTGQGTLPPVDVGEYLGLRPRWIDSTAVGGASWEVMAAHAADAIAAGHADVVLLTYGSTARSDLRKGLRGANINWGARGPLQWEAPYGHTLISKYAMAARRHMFTYGTTIEQLAEVAVSARFNAADNPEAYYRDPITIDDVLGGPMIADPFTKLHCCIRSDGGAAAVLVSAERAKDLRSKPVWVLGSGETTSHMLTSQWNDLTVGPAAVSGPLAFARAGVSPSDVDVAEIYDAFTYMLLLTIEDLGFCPKGEGGPYAADGHLGPGGTLAMNTNGGGLSFTHPGMYGMFLITEAVRQLRGEAGPRQVDDANVAVAHGSGMFLSVMSTAVLGTEATL